MNCELKSTTRERYNLIISLVFLNFVYFIKGHAMLEIHVDLNLFFHGF